MADLIQWARTAQRTGLLQLRSQEGKEIELVFRDGRIAFSSTNEKRNRWRAYLIYLGLTTGAEMEEAFRVREKTGASVASILVAQGTLTHEQATSTLTEKTLEDVCDVFLWPDGDFTFQPKVVEFGEALAINLDPIHLVFEGIRRNELWSRMNATIHPTSMFERTNEHLDDRDKWEDVRVAKHVFVNLDGNATVSELVDKLPFSRFRIYRAIAELLERRLLIPADVTAVSDRMRRTARKVDDARAAAANGRWTEAMEILQGLIVANPGRQDLIDELMSVTHGFERAVYEHNFTQEDVPVVTIGFEALSRMMIDQVAGFLLSRIDGRLTVREILRISPMPEFDGLRAFKRLLAAKVIDFPSRKAPQDILAGRLSRG